MTTNGSKLCKGKVRAMIAHGFGDVLVHRFIKEKSKVLTMGGVKNASNIPKEGEKRIEFIANLFGKKDHLSILSSWVLQQDDLEAEIDTQEAMAKLADLNAKQADDPSLAPWWRSIFLTLMRDPDSVAINTFLGDAPSAPKKIVAKHRQEGDGEGLDLDAAFRIAKGEAVQISKDQYFLKFISILTGIITKSFDEVSKDLAELRADSRPDTKKLVEVLEALIERASPPRHVIGRQTRSAIHSLPDGINGHDCYQVLGKMATPQIQGHRFFEIFAVIHEENVYKLTKDGAKQLFPQRGSAIIFANKLYGKAVPQWSEWVLTIKKIEDGDTHTAEYEVASIDRKLSEVIGLRHASSEADAVRDQIKRFSPTAGVIPVFELADKILIPTPNFPPNFDEPIGYLETLVTYELDGRNLVVDEISGGSGYVDLSPPEVVIRRLFKARADLDGVPKITKAQVTKLTELASQEARSGVLGSSLHRAQGHIDALLGRKQEVELAIQELLGTPIVSESLEAEKQRILSEYRDSLDSHRQELAGLQEDKKKLEKEIEAFRKQQEAQASQLGAHLRDAFEKASSDGLKVLSDVALLSPFLGGKPRLAKPKALPALKAAGTPAREPKNLLGAIVCYSIRHGLSQPVLSHAIASSLACGLVGLFGKSAPLFQQSIAGTLSGGLTATVSLSSDMFGWRDVLSAPVATSLPDAPAMNVGDFIALAQHSRLPCHVSVVGANRIPLETYFPELALIAGFGGIGNVITWRNIDEVFSSVSVLMPIFISLVFIRGKSTFQLEAPVSSELAIINCDAKWDQRVEPDPTMKISGTYVDMAGNGGYMENAQETASEYMQALHVPKNEADVLTSLGYRVGRASIGEMELKAGNLQGDLGERYLSYVRHEGNKFLSQLCESEGSNQ
jgi:hypothetical protein